MNEEEIKIKDIIIKYIFKERKYDTKHLIVVFSGFGGKSEFTYDFLNALSNTKSNVLWIKDEFFGHCSYYMAHKNNFAIDNSIIELIHRYMAKTAVSREEVTILGASKGGSAALYFGIKYGFSNIVATVPQLLIGTYLERNQPVNAIHIMGDLGKVEDFNRLILDQIAIDNMLNKNIYILTSESDDQYKDHIEPFLSRFYKYNNINLLLSESILAREHNQITSHHTDVIIGLISMLGANLVPRIGFKSLKGDIPVKLPEKPQAVISLEKLYVKSGRLFIEGVGIIRGIEAINYNQVNYNLILLKNDSSKIVLNIAKDHKPWVTRAYYNGNFCIYDKCWFTTYKYQGVDISHIAQGTYKIYLEMVFSNVNVTEALVYSGEKSHSGKSSIEVKNNSVYLHIE